MYQIEKIKVSKLLQIMDNLLIKYKLNRQEIECSIDNLSSVYSSNEYSLIFVGQDTPDQVKLIHNTLSKVIICTEKSNLEDIEDKILIYVENPKLAYAKIVNSILCLEQTFMIHPTATIHEDAKIHGNCYIGPHTYIGKATIDEGTIIQGNCYIFDNVTIGKRVFIDPGCVIGSKGFGFVRDEDEIPIRFPQIGCVIIEDDVEIGANTCINRGALNNTIIHEGAKIDNLVHIAHNVEIGRYSYIISNSVISGSSKVGDYCWIAPTTTVINKVRIGDRSVIGIGSVIMKNVPNEQTWMGYPAVPVEKFIQNIKK